MTSVHLVANATDVAGGLAILVLATFVGYEVIRRVPTLLHTPLMSGSNALSGIVVVGGIVVAGHPGSGTVAVVLALIAIALAMVNVVGGFLVTDRMLRMFKRKPDTRRPSPPEPRGAPPTTRAP